MSPGLTVGAAAADLARLAVQARQGGDLARAEALFRRVLALEPAWVEAAMGLAWTLFLAGRGAEGLSLLPDHPATLTLRGEILCGLQRFAEAEPILQQAPPTATTLYNLAALRLTLGRPAQAEAACRALLGANAQWAEAWNLLGMALLDQGRPEAADDAFRAAIKAGGGPRIASNLLLSQLYRADRTPEQVAHLHRMVGDQLSLGRPRPALPALDGRRLRVGYLSPDFRTHAVAGFLEPVLARHDRATVEVFCYDAKPLPEDPVAHRLRTLAEHWRDIQALDDDAAAALVARDGIDVLVDLAGHTADNRLGVFVRRPAPVQVTWLGYAATTGLAEMDARLSDAACDPPGERGHTREPILRLPAGFLCWRPPSDPPPVAPLADGAPVFGCFGVLAKMTAQVLALWARLLHAVPDARLILKARPLAEPQSADAVRAAFARHGIGPERLDLLARVPDTAGHLALYGRIHVALDTFPYAGTTTVMEALSMGVPVVSLRGGHHAARVGADILDRVGLSDLAVPDSDAYIATAAALARDRARLADLRGDGPQGLRARLATSTLSDEAGFTRHLEAAFLALARGEAP